MPKAALRFVEGHTTAGQLVVSLEGREGLKQLEVPRRSSCIVVIESKKYPWFSELRDQALRVAKDGQQLEWSRARRSFSIPELIKLVDEFYPYQDVVNFYPVAWNLSRRRTDVDLSEILGKWWYDGGMLWTQLEPTGRATRSIITKIRGVKPRRIDTLEEWRSTGKKRFRLLPGQTSPDADPDDPRYGQFELVATDGDCLELLGTHGAIKTAHILKRGTPPVH